MILRALTPQPLSAPGLPTVMATTSCAEIACGCRVYVGTRGDNGEVAAATVACHPNHEHVSRHTQLLLLSSLVDPQDRPLVEVCDELLEQAARTYGIPVS